MTYRILFLFLLPITVLAQSYKVSVGSNITNYEFANSAGTNPISLRSESGLALGLSREFSLSKVFVLDLSLAYNQFNAVGDIQNIPLAYSTDFIGLSLGVGPSLNLGKGFSFNAKAVASASGMVKGNQFIQNRYVDLFADKQFNSLRTLYGYSFEINKQINEQVGVFAKYQHLDSYNFGSSTLNFIPSTFSIGISLSK
jgi:hypothetical protein